ncbi:MAG: [Fe-Fe] hydrogenase large subunit C-terminal domain-containing protein [Cellulosilyticaceae bacterium]
MNSHSVTLQSEKCIGCTDCIKRCPTEAIRVKGSKAKIIEERCIDCGNCIAICRNGAKKAVTDKLDMIDRYQYKIALPAPSFYAQFAKASNIEVILETFYDIGFTDVVEVAGAAEVIAQYTRQYIEQSNIFPVISSACPVIVRIIQRRFPALIDHILPIMSPMELAARYVKETYKNKGIKESDVGVFFISPCPAKATEIHRPKGLEKSYVDGVLSMQDVYRAMVHQVNHKKESNFVRQSGHAGLSWATRNGAVTSIAIENHIAVDGMESVIEILEKVEDGTLANVQYIEALACVGGCLGGALTIENPFVSRHTLKKWMDEDMKKDPYYEMGMQETMAKIPIKFEKSIDPRLVFSLDEDIATAIEMMEKIDMLYRKLPRIDCGSCGAPTCKCFAEDVVKGFSNVEDCVFMLKNRIKELSEAMLELTQKVMPTQEK